MGIRLFSDFDGPLVDVSDRYYRVYCYCAGQLAEAGQPVSLLTKEQFWTLKRDRVSVEQIAIQTGFQGDRATEFARLRRELVHSDPYFGYDVIQPSAISALQQLREAGVELAVMTMRRVRELEPALERFGLAEFFPPHLRYCLPNDYIKQGDTRDKPKLMARALAELPTASRSWMVGDTEADMLAGSTHSITTIGVLSGIRNENQLSKYNPTAIVPTVAEATQIVFTELYRRVS